MSEGRGVTIRRYRSSDRSSLQSMYARTPPAGTTTADRQPWPDDLEHMDECYLAAWVAVDPAGGAEPIVGMVGVALPDPALAGDVFRELQGLVQLRRMRVAPEWQRRGVGRRLTETVIDWAASSGAQALVLETTASRRRPSRSIAGWDFGNWHVRFMVNTSWFGSSLN